MQTQYSFLVSFYGFRKAWTVHGVRRDLKPLRVQGSQPHINMAHGLSVVPPSTALLLWETFPIRHRRRCFPVSGCSGSLSPSSVSVHNISSSAEPHRTGISEQTKLHLLRCPCAGRLWQGAQDWLHVTHGRGQKSTGLMCVLWVTPD